MEKQEILKIRKENKKVAYSVTTEYIKTYLKSLLLNPNGNISRKDLITNLFDYFLTIKEENSYMKYISDNFDSIRNKETLFDILNDLDFIKEKTFSFYQEILLEFENITTNRSKQNINVQRKFSNISESTTYLEYVKGLFLTDEDLYKYYQHEDAYYYLKSNNKILNTSVEEGLPFFGCYYETNNELISKVSLCTPKITDLITMLINVREYKTGITLYSHLGKELPHYNFEIEASKEEDNFIKKYLLKK